MRHNLLFTIVAFGILAFLFSSCDGLFDVQDPQRYTDEDLNTEQALQAVSDGVLGDLYAVVDDFIEVTALLSDEYVHTGTWNAWDQISKGEIRAGIPNGSGNGPFNQFAQVRWSAQDAAARIEGVLGEEASDFEGFAQVKVTEAFSNLYLAMGYCEAPAEPGGTAVSDQDLLQQANTLFSEALQIAESAGFEEWTTLARAGRARARLLAGDFDGALADAQTIPDGFAHYAVMSVNSDRQNNDIVQITNKDFNKAAGLHPNWWDMVDAEAGFLVDPWTGELDERVPIFYEDGALGVDGNTPHYSEMKYTSLDDDIPLIRWQEMRLIEAEVYMRQDEPGQAMSKINDVREAAGLSALPTPSDNATIEDYLIHERFAQLFLEGHRLQDLNRFGRIADELGSGRATKLPISTDEVNANSNISYPRSCPSRS